MDDKKTNTLPKEFEEIKPIESFEEMFSITTDIISKLKNNDSNISPLQKYSLSLARQYFNKNVNSFSKEDYLKALKTTFFIKNLPSENKKNLFLNALKEKVSSPVVLPEWFTSWGFQPHQFRDYISIINKENNKSQLEFFNSKIPKEVERFYKETSDTHSDSLIEIVSDKAPMKYLINNSHSEAKMINWIDKNKKEMLTYFYTEALTNNWQETMATLNSLSHRSGKSLEKFFSVFLDHLSNIYNKEKNNKNHCTVLSLFLLKDGFWDYLQNNYQEYLKKILLERQHSESMNFAQNMLFESKKENYKKYREFSEKFFEAFNLPVRETIKHYTLEVPIIEHALRTDKLLLLIPFVRNQDKLNDNEKKIMCCMALDAFLDTKKNSGFSGNDSEFKKLISNDILLNMDNKIFKSVLKNYSSNTNEELKAIERLKSIENIVGTEPAHQSKAKKI